MAIEPDLDKKKPEQALDMTRQEPEMGKPPMQGRDMPVQELGMTAQALGMTAQELVMDMPPALVPDRL
jgi:hypothetical protein